LFAKEHAFEHPWVDALAPALQKRAKRTAAPTVRATPPPAHVDAILAAPEDDDVRLVFADWLSEQGDPLGEFIQIQCALGRALIGAGGKYASRTGRKLPFESRKELEARERELLKEHERVWLAPVRAHIREWQTRRGFLDHVVADVRAFLDGLDALCKVPLSSVQLTGFKPEAADDLLRARRHPSLHTMDFSQNRIGPRLAHVLGSELFAHVRTLRLYGNPLGEAGLARLAQCPFPELESLQLSRVEMTPRGIETLSRAPFFARLRHLDLYWNEGLDASCVPALERATALETLRIGSTSIGDDGLQAIARSKAFTQLRSIDIPYNASEETREVLRQRFPAPE
jgi:uncharacterized protein (TIGR02996 family)